MKKHDKNWNTVTQIKICANMAQAKLSIKDYRDARTFCAQVLKMDPKNIKSMFRMSKVSENIWKNMNIYY